MRRQEAAIRQFHIVIDEIAGIAVDDKNGQAGAAAYCA
jgi:hypothetical protein